MAVCPICGCKTDELDFVERKISDADCKVCSFCSRQLNVFDTTEEPTEAQLRWLIAVIGKDVPERADNISSALKDIRSRYTATEIPQSATPAQQNVKIVQQGGSNKSSKLDYETDDVINELKNRVVALENEIRTMKRKQMIKTIVELGAPVVLLILLVIIVLSSGLIDNIKAIFDMAGIVI